MICTGIVRGNCVELDGGVVLPEGTRVQVIPQTPANGHEHPLSLGEWLEEAQELREQLPMTSNSTDLLRRMREERAGR